MTAEKPDKQQLPESSSEKSGDQQKSNEDIPIVKELQDTQNEPEDETDTQIQRLAKSIKLEEAVKDDGGDKPSQQSAEEKSSKKSQSDGDGEASTSDSTADGNGDNSSDDI